MARFELIELYRDETRQLFQMTEIVLSTRCTASFGQCLVQIRPIAVVVCEVSGIRTFGVNGDDVAVGALRRDCPPLDDILGGQTDA